MPDLMTITYQMVLMIIMCAVKRSGQMGKMEMEIPVAIMKNIHVEVEKQDYQSSLDIYIYDIYNDGNYGRYLTDLKYGDVSCLDKEPMTRELAVGRLVEEPKQIIGIISTYINLSGTNPTENASSLAQYDFIDTGKAAKNLMNIGVFKAVNSSLIGFSYNSNLVPPVLNSSHDLVYFGGHGNYNWISTHEKGNDGFMAGNSTCYWNNSNHGDTNKLSLLNGSVIVTSNCHTGVNFGNKLYAKPDTTTRYSEFPEEFAKKKVVAYIGSTGYTWISPHGYSPGFNEKIAIDIIQLLLPHITSSIHFWEGRIMRIMYWEDGWHVGDAFIRANNNYYLNSNKNNGDRKVVGIMQLYGIPHYILNMSNFTPAFQLPIRFSANSKTKYQSPGYLETEVVINVTDYTVNTTTGLVEIPGASYYGGKGVTVPLIPIGVNLPYGAEVSNVIFNQAESQSTPIYTGGNIPVPYLCQNNFSCAKAEGLPITGFYPDVVYSTGTMHTIGVMNSTPFIYVSPVQYNNETREGKIWTKIKLLIQYTIPCNKITNLEAGLSAVLAENESVDVTANPQNGTKDILIKKGTIPIAKLKVDFWDTATADFSGVHADTDGEKSVIHVPESMRISSLKTLYIPVKRDTGWVYICPNATNLREVYLGCPGYYIQPASSSGGYYIVTVTGSGGGESSPPKGMAVGGEVIPVNKVDLVMPYILVSMLIGIAGTGIYVVRRRISR